MKYKYKKIKDIATVYSGTTPSTSILEFWNGNIKWITPAELQDGHNWYIYDTERKITEEAIRRNNLKMLKKGTILLTTRAPIGKVALVGEEMCTNQGFKNIECNTDIVNPEFLYFWILSNKEYLNSLGRGATFKEISKTIVENIQVPVPPLKIQEKIVKILTQSLSLIEKRKAQIEALDQLTQSVFYDILNKSNPKRVKFSDVIAETKNGMSRRGNELDGNIVLRLREIKENTIDYKEINRIKLNDKEKINFLLKQNDLLLVRVNGNPEEVGRSAVFNQLDEPVYFNDHIIRIRTIENVDNNYIAYYLNSTFGKKEIRKYIKTSAGQYTISRDGINKITLLLPSKDKQNKFAKLFHEIEKKKINLYQNLIEFENLFNSLMQRAFNGELFTEEKVSNL